MTSTHRLSALTTVTAFLSYNELIKIQLQNLDQTAFSFQRYKDILAFFTGQLHPKNISFIFLFFGFLPLQTPLVTCVVSSFFYFLFVI